MSALEGVVVLERSSTVAAAYCGRLLATYGARVTLLEPPTGSPLRRQGPFPPGTGEHGDGALFLALGRGKQSATLDPATSTGAALFDQLCANADVLIVDTREPWLSWESLHRRFPSLILVDVSPFGRSGPYADFTALPGALYALGGYSFMTGDPHREPLQGPPNIPGCLAAANAYVGVTAALFSRLRTGEGQRVEVSAIESLAAAHQWTVTRYEYSGRIQQRNNSRYDSLHPVTYYTCADGTVAVAPSTEEQLERMLLLIGREDLLSDPRFNTNYLRVQNADTFDEEVAPWFLERTRKEITEACQAFRVPVAPAYEIDEVLQHEQLIARGYWQTEEHPVAGELTVSGAPFRLPESPALGGRAPLLGEHNDSVYGELGVGARSLDALREAAII